MTYEVESTGTQWGWKQAHSWGFEIIRRDSNPMNPSDTLLPFAPISVYTWEGSGGAHAIPVTLKTTRLRHGGRCPFTTGVGLSQEKATPAGPVRCGQTALAWPLDLVHHYRLQIIRNVTL